MRLLTRPKQNAPSQKIKRWGKQVQEDLFQEDVISMKDFRTPIAANVKGVNSSLQTYNVLVSGTTGGHLWSLNLSSLPGEQKRLLTVLGATTFLVNYALDSYPSRINLVLNETTGSMDEQGNASHNIASIMPVGPATPVQNPGNIIGYNVTYSLVGNYPPVDITGIPSITFDVSADNSLVPVAYPLATPIALIVQITHVMF